MCWISRLEHIFNIKYNLSSSHEIRQSMGTTAVAGNVIMVNYTFIPHEKTSATTLILYTLRYMASQNNAKTVQ